MLSRRAALATLVAVMIAAPLGAASSSSAAPVPSTIYSLDPIPGLEYVAIAPLTFADRLQPLIDWKTEKGVPAQVIPLEYILAPPAVGRDDAEKLHNFLVDLYFTKTNPPRTPKWLLLVGDGDWDRPIIPLREVFTNSQQDGDPFNNGNWYTTDTYFGNLESSWDEDGDGTFGELNEGDWTPEMYVGRVPVDTAAQLDLWVQRQLTYEKSPPIGVWMRRGVLAGALMDRPNVFDNPLTRADEGYDPFTDNARKVDEEVAAEAPLWMDLERFYDYPFWDGGAYSTATDTLVAGAVKSALDSGASFLLMEGHGYTSNSGVAQYADPTGTASIFRSDSEEPALRFDEVLNLTNGDMRPFVYVSACYSGDFTDRDDTSFEAFLKAPAGGAIAVVAGNGENFRLENVSGQQAFGNWWLAREFFHMLFVEGYSQPGKVLGDLKARYNDYYLREGPTDAINRNYFRAERVSYNLMGDPEFSVITDAPANLEAQPLRQPLVGESFVQVQVTGRGGALAGALVHVKGPGGDTHARTNATGVATLRYAVADTTPFNITVTAPNHAPLSTSAVPAVPEHNLAFEPGALSASGVFQRNQTITVSGTVAARGLASYANVVVEFQLGNPSVGTPISAAVLPTVAPGTPRPISAALSFAAPGDYVVYATIDPAGELAEDTRADNVAFVAVRINAPPQVHPIPTLTVAEGGLATNALFLPSYVTDRESGAFALGYRIAFVSDANLLVVLDGTNLSLQALPGAPLSVTVELEAYDGLDTGRGTFTVDVVRDNRAPLIAPVSPARAVVGQALSLNLTGVDPEGLALVWTDSSPLFDVSPSGRITFTPTADQVGSFAATVTASDGRLSASHTFLIMIDKRETSIEVRNPPAVRGSPGVEIVLDLNQISPDPDVTFVPDSGAVRIDPLTRTLHYTPAPGEPRVETLLLNATKPGMASTRVAVTVDVAAAPAGAGADVLVFLAAGAGVAGLVALTEWRSHQNRLRDERVFKLPGKPPRAGERLGKDPAPKGGRADKDE